MGKAWVLILFSLGGFSRVDQPKTLARLSGFLMVLVKQTIAEGVCVVVMNTSVQLCSISVDGQVS